MSQNQHTFQLGVFKNPMFAKDFADNLGQRVRPSGVRVELEWSKNGSRIHHQRKLGDKIVVESSRDRFNVGKQRSKPDRWMNVHFPGDLSYEQCLDWVVQSATELLDRQRDNIVPRLLVAVLSRADAPIKSALTIERSIQQ